MNSAEDKDLYVIGHPTLGAWFMSGVVEVGGHDYPTWTRRVSQTGTSTAALIFTHADARELNGRLPVARRGVLMPRSVALNEDEAAR